MWRRWLEACANKAWYRGAWWAFLLLPLSWCVGLLVSYRRQRYLSNEGLLAPLPVVVVGGITVGGTGKSPVVVALAKALAGDFRVGVVSRGYGGSAQDEPHRVDPEVDSASVVGDEPLMIARQLGCPVWVCRHRALAVEALAYSGDADVILADDGLQHYAMARDFEIAVSDVDRGFGNGWLIPAGPLREPVSRLESVDWCLVRNGHELDSAFHYRVLGVRQAGTTSRYSLSDKALAWTGLRLIAVTGLGQPAQFFELLRANDLDVTPVVLADHAAIGSQDIVAGAGDIILITAKDEAKLTAPYDSRLWVVDVEAELPPALIEAIKLRIRNRETFT